MLRGIRLTAFYDKDAYVKNGERNRFIGSVTFEHKYVNAGFDYFNRRGSAAGECGDGHGQGGCERPVVLDHAEDDDRHRRPVPLRQHQAERQHRSAPQTHIAGIAYWFPHQGSVLTAALLDFEQVRVRQRAAGVPPTQQRIAVHMLVNF